MSNSSRTSESSDDGSQDHNYLDVPYGGPGSPQSSDSGDLEVVESENPTLAYEKNYEDDPTFQPLDVEKKYFSEFSHNDRESNPAYEGASHFYNSYGSNKNEEVASYSLDNSPINSEGYSFEELNHDSISTKSKKKKEKSSKSNDSSNSGKNKKRKNDSKSGRSKKSRTTNHIAKSDSVISSKHIKRTSTTLSEYSSDSNASLEGTKIQNYTSSYSLKRPSISSAEDPDNSEEDSAYTSYSKNENKNLKKKFKTNFDETVGLKKRLESSNKGNLLMKKMGYREGEGLGKNAQGRVDPVELSKQKGRRGLGLSLPGLDGEPIEWDPNLQEINEKEPIDWLENNEEETLDYDTMVDEWICEGPKNLDIESMTEFIDEELLSNILKKKAIFDNLSEDELRRAVSRSNPFETIRKGIFLNRAALKMANMDFAFDYMFTNPKYRDGSQMVRENELLYFADVCAGPGGFSEYVLFRKMWQAKGIGFTLKGDNDFKLQDFLAGPSETFEPYYGEKEDGNIFDPGNIRSLTKFVMKVTEGKGVHFMMADGGFSVKGQENIQELLSKQLYLCQFLIALSIVQEEGHFVCKIFDLFSVFSAGLIYLMYKAFHKICIFKPNTSRPANSERYIICKHKKRDTEAIRNYLFEINLRLLKLGNKSSNHDVNECVPLEIIKDNIEFFSYLRDSNNRFGNRQIVNLDKIIAYYQDQTLHEPLQNELRSRCMELWNVPPGPRKSDRTSDFEATKNILQSILKEKFKPQMVSEILNLTGKHLTPKNIKEIFNYSILDWQCIPLGSDKLCFLLGLGRNRVYRWNNSKWEHEANIELTPGTLIYGEFMPEYRGDSMKQTKVTAFHIIDGFAIGYKSLANQPYNERLATLNLYTKALKKWNKSTLYPIRVKNPTALKNIYFLFERVKDHFLKTSCQHETCLFDNDHDYFMQLKGVAFIRTTREPWRRHRSKKNNCYYYYNSESRDSLYEQDRPPQAVASAIDSLRNQVLWMLEAGVGFKGEDKHDFVLHKDDLVEFIQKKQSEM